MEPFRVYTRPTVRGFLTWLFLAATATLFVVAIPLLAWKVFTDGSTHDRSGAVAALFMLALFGGLFGYVATLRISRLWSPVFQFEITDEGVRLGQRAPVIPWSDIKYVVVYTRRTRMFQFYQPQFIGLEVTGPGMMMRTELVITIMSLINRRLPRRFPRRPMSNNLVSFPIPPAWAQTSDTEEIMREIARRRPDLPIHDTRVLGLFRWPGERTIRETYRRPPTG